PSPASAAHSAALLPVSNRNLTSVASSASARRRTLVPHSQPVGVEGDCQNRRVVMSSGTMHGLRKRRWSGLGARQSRRAIAVGLLAQLSATSFAWVPRAGAQAASGCIGDCNNDVAVTVDEIVIGVNIALEAAPLARCPRFDCNGTGQATVP